MTGVFMTTKTATRAGLLAATALAGVLGTSGPAAADSMSSIEAQIRQLQAQLGHVKADLAARRQETAKAQAAADEARREAREANQRANASAGSQSFSGSQTGGVFGSSNGGTFSAQNLPNNGLGPHGVQSVGQQQASGLGSFGKFRLGGVTVTLGGFVAAEGVERSRNDVADIGMTFNSIPYPTSAQYHEPEFRGSGRQSRLSLLVEGAPSTVSKVAAYFETDFLTVGTTSNSNESNSYALRVRQAYATYDNSTLGFHFLGGQAWSMATQDRVGITPRQENIPLTIDAQYVVGFNWARQWQVRFVKDFDDHRIWAGLSFEEPQVTYSVTSQNVAGVNSPALGTQVNYVNAGGSLLNATANYSDDIAPDVIAKLAFDPGFGHYEVLGVSRFVNARDYTVPTALTSVEHDNNRITIAGFGGANALIPIIGKKLVFQATGAAGEGIGRYASGQLPDATISPNGSPRPIPEVSALFGLVYHPTKAWDLYAYTGTEQEAKTSWNYYKGKTVTAYGYGNGYYVDTGCFTEGSTAACSGQTRGLVHGTLGGWWRFMHGDYGTLEVGAQYEYIRRTAFNGTSVATVGKTTVDSVVTPKTDDNAVLFSFRYLPFL